MCIPHPPTGKSTSSGRIKRDKIKKEFISYDKEARMKADPDFTDDRVALDYKNEKSFFQKIKELFDDMVEIKF